MQNYTSSSQSTSLLRHFLQSGKYSSCNSSPLRPTVLPHHIHSHLVHHLLRPCHTCLLLSSNILLWKNPYVSSPSAFWRRQSLHTAYVYPNLCYRVRRRNTPWLHLSTRGLFICVVVRYFLFASRAPLSFGRPVHYSSGLINMTLPHHRQHFNHIPPLIDLTFHDCRHNRQLHYRRTSSCLITGSSPGLSLFSLDLVIRSRMAVWIFSTSTAVNNLSRRYRSALYSVSTVFLTGLDVPWSKDTPEYGTCHCFYKTTRTNANSSMWLKSSGENHRCWTDYSPTNRPTHTSYRFLLLSSITSL